jgi:hypothetical protein
MTVLSLVFSNYITLLVTCTTHHSKISLEGWKDVATSFIWRVFFLFPALLDILREKKINSGKTVKPHTTDIPQDIGCKTLTLK